MGKKKQIPYILKINLFQHGSFEGEEGWRWSKAQSLPVDVEKKVEEGEHLDFKSGRGRKIGSGWTHPGRIIGRVHSLIEDGKKNKNEAFKQVAKERGYRGNPLKGISGDEIVKDIYYKSLRKEYRDETIFTDGVIFEAVPSSGSEIYDPEYVMEKAIDRDGKEAAKRALAAYIEEAQELLNNEETIQVVKDIVNKHRLIQKAKSLMAQLG